MATVEVARAEVIGAPACVQVARAAVTYASAVRVYVQVARAELAPSLPIDTYVAKGGVWVGVQATKAARNGSWL